MPSWTYKGIEITVNATAVFTAKVAGQEITAPSLQAAKNRIDKHPLLKFKPFKVLKYRSGSVVEITVTGIKPGRSFRASAYFFTDNPLYSWLRDGVEATAKGRKALLAYERASEAERKRQNIAEKRLEKLENAIPLIRASTYGMQQ